MSNQRLVWSDTEKDLLVKTRNALPRATVEELAQVFNQNNHQARSSTAVRTKLRLLGLSSKPKARVKFPTMPATLRGLSSPHRSKTNVRVPMKPAKLTKELQRTYNRPVARFDWGVLELGIFLPLHPLLAAAREHATRPRALGDCGDSRVALPWPSTLGMEAISNLRCGEKDKLVLQQYMDYLRGWNPKSRGLMFPPGEGYASQGVHHAVC